ncbi:hypothetical protein [Alteriqipengyuania lutimaris]|nr:hypothetical protein [Alteriqipengyuania lutimaris]MBB3033470.1 hypothetical protein [Alteriqipengyuania lutimaris]
MSGEAIFTLVAALAVTAVMAIPAIVARRLNHGEARIENLSKEPSGDD